MGKHTPDTMAIPKIIWFLPEWISRCSRLAMAMEKHMDSPMNITAATTGSGTIASKAPNLPNIPPKMNTNEPTCHVTRLAIWNCFIVNSLTMA